MGLTLYTVIVVLFALWATVHLLLCRRLAAKSPLRAAAGFIFPPLAIYYAQAAFVGKLSWLWVLTLSAYLVALTLGFIG